MTATYGDAAGGSAGGGGAPASSGVTRFADYFAIVGLDLSSGLEPDTLSGDNLHVAPLSRPYKCAVLGHHPERYDRFNNIPMFEGSSLTFAGGDFLMMRS